jgi:hypothetical protein
MVAGWFFKRLLQLIALIGAGLAVAIAVGELADYSRSHTVPSSASVSIAVFTAVTFVAVTVQFRHCWRRATFLMATTALLVLHVVAFVSLLGAVPDWRLVWFVPVNIVETQLLCLVLYKAGFGPGNRHTLNV